MGAETKSHDTEIASVLFADIVAYTLLADDRKPTLVHDLQTIVKECATSVFSRAPGDLIMQPTGDGAAIVFLRNPIMPTLCALEIARALRQHPEIPVRMGVHIGPVFRHLDINGDVTVLGAGIDYAQRIMSCGDAGHILVSHCVAEVLEQFTEWHGCLRDLGVHEVKNGARVHLYNVYKDGVGNPETPRLIRVTDETPPPAAAAPPENVTTRPRRWILAGSITALVLAGGLIVGRSGIVHFGRNDQKLSLTDSTKPSPAGAPATDASVTIPDATPIYITLRDDVPADGSGGQTLSFTVRDDLKVGDALVVAKGAKVIGAVEWGKKMLGLMGKRANFRLMQADTA